METDRLVEQSVEKCFFDTFGFASQGTYSSPGRVNLIGEHTDYNDGFVLPVAINFRTVIAASKRDDNVVDTVAMAYGNARVRFHCDNEIVKNPTAPWSDYLAGVIKEFQERNLAVSGMNLVIGGDVPQGAGLSSSASFELAVALALKHINALDLTGVEVAKICQAAENTFVGCNCGIMDQLISALGRAGHAMLLDCRSLQARMVPIPQNLNLVIVNSNVARDLVGSEYNVRRQQCEAAAAFFGVSALRDVSLEQLVAAKNDLSNVIFRRARHIITENARTIAAADALANNDIVQLSRLMQASHESMRDDFEITVEPIDQLVELLQRELGELGGVRMTGGGFGGCVIALVPDGLKESVVELVQTKYQKITGFRENIYLCEASDGSFTAI